MSNQKPKLIKDEIYHVYNRGVAKRDIFLNDRDYLRFVYNMFVSNGQDRFTNISRLDMNEIATLIRATETNKNNQLVEILSFVLMPNHFHLVLKQKEDTGITKFMQKLGTSTTMCFNKKYERVGPLFQGNFKAVHIEDEDQFNYISHYVHLNPLDLMEGDPKYIQMNDKMHFLKHYRWSSLPDFLGYNNFSNIFNKDFFLENFGSKKKYEKEMRRIIRVKVEEISLNQSVLLD